MISTSTQNFRNSLNEIKLKVPPVTKWSRVADWGLYLTIVNFTTQCGKNRHTDIANFVTLIQKKKLIHCVAIFTILYGNHYPPYGEFKLICIGKFARGT